MYRKHDTARCGTGTGNETVSVEDLDPVGAEFNVTTGSGIWKEFKSEPRNVKTACKKLDQYLDPDSEKILGIRIHTHTKKTIGIPMTNLSGILQKSPDSISHSEALGMKLLKL
jgi:hypothetical protein